MRRIVISAAILGAAVVFVVLASGASEGTKGQSFKIELDNAFGLVQGADFKVAGVRAGKIDQIDLCWHKEPHCQNPWDALVTVSINQTGFGSFRSDAFCQTRPQSLIGEYFVECQPGQNGQLLKNNGLIPVSRTGSTVPADLLNNVMRLPYRERFTLIINELGAAVAGRSADLQSALRRAVPALTQTDNLLNLLANDSKTLQALTANSDAVVTALANNSTGVQNFVDQANRASTATAAEQNNLRLSLAKLPGFLEQLRPTLQKLGTATEANLPVLRNLNAASGDLNRFFTDLPGFAHASIPALQSLGQASVTGRVAVKAATPTVKHLNTFAKPTPELAQNLAIVGHSLDDRGRAVEADLRSPGGKGYTGLEALLQYVFNQTLAINTFSTDPSTGKPLYHQLTVDAFVDQMCSPYATPRTIAQSLKQYGPAYRKCYAWLGPNQPAVNERDPSAPSACVPDPGALPPGRSRPPTVGSPCKLNGAADTSRAKSGQSNRSFSAASSGASPDGSSGSPSTAGPASSSSTTGGSGPPINLHSTIGQVIGGLPGGSSSSPSAGPRSGDSTSGTPSASASSSTTQSGGQAKQLLNYLLAP